MFPSGTVELDTLNALLFHTSVLGILLLVGVILRIKVNLFKKFFLPGSLIAGLIGFILNIDKISIFPSDMVNSWSSFPTILITIIFAPMLIGTNLDLKRIKQTQALQQVLWTWQVSFIQWGVLLLLTGLLFTPLFGSHPVFASLTEMGWSGGPATPAALDELFTSLGFPEGSSVGVTVASIGLIFGLVTGVILINYAVRKGYTSYIKEEDKLNTDDNLDIIPFSRQKHSSSETVKSNVVNGYVFHLLLIFAAVIIGWVLQFLIEPFLPGIPLYPMAMIGGFFVNLLIKRTILFEAIDGPTLRNIQGIALDFTVVSAIASVELPVVLDYFWRLLISSIIMLIVMFFMVFYLGPRLFQNDWFEHTIMLYGVMTGLVATGYVLLSIVDPDLKSDVSIAFGLRSPFVSPFIGGGILSVLLPPLLVSYG